MRPCTDVAYGSNVGTAFADFNDTHPRPCGVDVMQVITKAGDLINAIQVKYEDI